AGSSPTRATTASAAMRSHVRIALRLGGAARMGHRAAHGGADLLGVFPDVAGGVFARARLPRALALRELVVGELDVERALGSVDLDNVAVAQQRDRPADRGLRPD